MSTTFELRLGCLGCKSTEVELPDEETKPVQLTSADPVVLRSSVSVAHTPFLRKYSENDAEELSQGYERINNCSCATQRKKRVNQNTG